MLPWLSPLWLDCKKTMQFGIFVFAEVQEINFRGNLLGSKCDGDYHKYYLIIQQYAALLKKPAIFL